MQSGNLTTGKGLAANSVNGIITVIQNSLKLAYTLGELKEYTTDKIRRPKTKEKEVSCFSLAEQKKIEQAALSNKKRKFIGIVICLYSGLRIGELLALTWADIDFTKGTLAVNKTCHDGRDENGNLCRITDLPKTTSSKRMIPLPKQLLPVLKEYKRKAFRSMLWNRRRASRLRCDLIREPLNFCKSVCISSVKVFTRFGIRLLHALWNAEWT